jgi:hypothetical protein
VAKIRYSLDSPLPLSAAQRGVLIAARSFSLLHQYISTDNPFFKRSKYQAPLLCPAEKGLGDELHQKQLIPHFIPKILSAQLMLIKGRNDGKTFTFGG